MYLVGQNEIKKIIDNNLLDKVKFIIIKGPNNFGKTYLTKYLAQHYGMFYKAISIKVSTIRDLANIQGEKINTVYHLKDFDKASNAAKAALLKVAEETPDDIKIVVTTSSINFLDTLLSRAYVINIEGYTKDQIYEYAKVIDFDVNLLDRLINEFHISITPTLLKKYKDFENFEEVLDLVKKTINAINEGMSIDVATEVSSKFWKDDREKLFIYLTILDKCSHVISKDCLYDTLLIERALYRLNKLTITNYKQFVNNLLLEMI